MVSKHIFSGFAFRSPLHPRALRNLRARPPRALRSVGLDSSTLRTSYHWGLGCFASLRFAKIVEKVTPLLNGTLGHRFQCKQQAVF